jgi:hypothetical protein
MFLENNIREGNVELRNCEQYLHVADFVNSFQSLRNFGEKRTVKLGHLLIRRNI